MAATQKGDRAATRLDSAIRFVLLPLAVAALALHLAALLRTGLAEPVFFVAGPTAPDAYPLVAGFRLELIAPDRPQMRVGDRLLWLGDTDLRGAGHLGVDVAAIHGAGASGRVPVAFERDGVRHEVELTLGRHVPAWSRTPGLLGMLVAAAVIALRARRDGHTRLIAAAFLLGVVFQAPYHGLTPPLTVLSKVTFYVLGGIVPALFLYWALRFPPESRRPSHWLLLAPLALSAAFFGLRASYFTGGPVPPRLVNLWITWVNAATFATILGALLWSYARADAIGRRRVKWVLLGCGAGMLPSLTHSLTATDLGLRWYPHVEPWTHVAFALAPGGVLLALARQSLFDVDKILGITATAALIAAPLLFGAITLARPAEAALMAALGVREGAGRAALVALLMAAAVLLYRVANPQIERLLAPERSAIAQRALEALRAAAPAEPGEVFFDSVARQLATTFGCDSTFLIRPDDPLWPTISSVGAPLVFERGDSARRLVPGREVAAMVPLVQDEGTGAVVCLGPKRSGDVYTASDLAWAAAIAERALRGRGRLAEERLSRFVPSAVADAIRRGAEPAPIETTATVLFADIRGFTAFAERRSPGAVFGSLARFVTIASEVLERHGGILVELRGDAILAVFGDAAGAGRAEPEAVTAACELMERLRRCEAEGAALPAIGIGIATGPVFVGAVQAAERSLWGVIGHAANAAARLEALTRTLGASIAIDEATWEAAGEVARRFRRTPRVPLRGTLEPATVHWLPIAEAETSPESSLL